MFFLYLGAQALFRTAAPANLILVSAFVLLVASPHWLFDIGFQLSFLSVMAIFQLAQPGIDAYVRPLLAPVRHAGDLDRLQVKNLAWPARTGRRWRVRLEMIAEDWGDRYGRACERSLLLISRTAAGAGLLLGGMLVASISVQIWLGQCWPSTSTGGAGFHPGEPGDCSARPLSGGGRVAHRRFLRPCRLLALSLGRWTVLSPLKTNEWISHAPWRKRCPTVARLGLDSSPCSCFAGVYLRCLGSGFLRAPLG
jgi:hypothetical protein